PRGQLVETLVAGGWGLASLLASMIFLASALRLRRLERGWTDGTLFGRAVKVSADLGPATVGLLRPRVVVPRWITELPPAELELILRHEGEHVRSRDTLILAFGILAVAAVPWNP